MSAAEPSNKYQAMLGTGSASESESSCFSMLSANSGQEVMLELRFRNGNAIALGYAYLVSVSFDPSEGIRLEFTGHEVLITGTNLTKLFRGLVHHKITYIQELEVPGLPEAKLADTPSVEEVSIRRT